MTVLFNRQLSRSDLLAHVGDLPQLAGIRLAELSEGRERGVRFAEFRSGAGLNFSVLLDRGMDIGPAEYRGVPLAWISPAGFAHPAFFDPDGTGWLRTFGGGLLVGCGLTHLGAPDHDEGEDLGLHGRLSVTPATHIQFDEQWDGDECVFSLKGEVRQARGLGENLRLVRHLSVPLGQNRIALSDMVENLGDATSPLMILYHINLGFPLLDETCRLVGESQRVQARDQDAQAGLTAWDRFQPPTSDYREQVFYHDLPVDEQGWAQITLVNPRLRLKFTVRFHKTNLPNLIEWKMMGRGAYVLGLEPANCLVEGRSKERARGSLQFLAPGEQRDFSIEILVEETDFSNPANRTLA